MWGWVVGCANSCQPRARRSWPRHAHAASAPRPPSWYLPLNQPHPARPAPPRPDSIPGQLEQDLAAFMGEEEAIIYSYDIATIASVIPAFASRADILVRGACACVCVCVGLCVCVGGGRWCMRVRVPAACARFPRPPIRPRPNPSPSPPPATVSTCPPVAGHRCWLQLPGPAGRQAEPRARVQLPAQRRGRPGGAAGAHRGGRGARAVRGLGGEQSGDAPQGRGQGGRGTPDSNWLHAPEHGVWHDQLPRPRGATPPRCTRPPGNRCAGK